MNCWKNTLYKHMSMGIINQAKTIMYSQHTPSDMFKYQRLDVTFIPVSYIKRPNEIYCTNAEFAIS